MGGARRWEDRVGRDLSCPLSSLHERWVQFLRSLGPAECARGFHHSELGRIRVNQNMALYAWHGRHHVAQIEALRERKGWR